MMVCIFAPFTRSSAKRKSITASRTPASTSAMRLSGPCSQAVITASHNWCDQGKRAEARDVLAPIYRCFTDGFDTPILQDANALLNQPA
jgi:hypothetical protein